MARRKLMDVVRNSEFDLFALTLKKQKGSSEDQCGVKCMYLKVCRGGAAVLLSDLCMQIYGEFACASSRIRIKFNFKEIKVCVVT